MGCNASIEFLISYLGKGAKNITFQDLVLNNGGDPGVVIFCVFFGNHFLYEKHPEML